MSVHQVLLSKNTTFPMGEPNDLAETALDHVNRILKDHDYIRCASPEESKNKNTSLLKSKDTVHQNSDQRESAFEAPHRFCGPQKAKIESGEQLPNEGIEASDLSSLLEQFLEYEQASNQSTNLLTPATSPGHSENWNEQVHIKIDSHMNTTDLTPPTTPPVLEAVENKTAQMDCNTAIEQEYLKESDETSPEKKVDDHCLSRKRKSEDGETNDTSEENGDSKKAKLHFDFNNAENDLKESSKACGESMEEETNKVNDSLNEQQENKHEEGESNKGESNGCLSAEKSQSNSGDTKSQSCDLNDQCEKHEDKLTSDAEVTGDRNSCEANVSKIRRKSIDTDTQHHCKDDRHRLKKESINTKSTKRIHKDERQRKKRSVRRHSTHIESSDDERYNPRRCEQSKERYRETSKDSYERERRHDHRRRSSREDSTYDHNRNSKYSDDKRRKYDHRNDRNKRRWKNVRDIEQERKIDFRLGRSLIKDVAKEERRVVYVGGLPYGTTRDELWNRLRRFGPVEEITVHLREGERENYGFVTFFESDDARQCIERGNSDPKEPHLDLCFGGRRQYCGGSYVDFDSKTSHIEELSETYGNVRGELREEDDFDTLLRKYEEEVRDTMYT